MKEKSLQMNIDDPILMEILTKLVILENNIYLYEDMLEETEYEVHQQRDKEAFHKLVEQRRLYRNLLVYRDDQLKFNTVKFEKDCKRIFNSKSLEFIQNYMESANEYIQLKQEMDECAKRGVYFYKKMNPKKFTLLDQLVFPASVPFYSQLLLYELQALQQADYPFYVIFACAGLYIINKTKQVTTPDLKNNLQIERDQYIDLSEALQECDEKLEQQFLKWAQNQPWLTAYMDIYLKIQTEKLKTQQDKKTYQKKKQEMN